MKMVSKAAVANFKYNRGRNFLVGIAICLTTLLLFLIPGAAQAMVKLEFAAINEMYPTWHMVLRNVDEEIAEQVALRKDVETVGLRCDIGEIPSDKASIGMTAMDDACAQLNRMELSEGHYPENESEIVVSDGLLEAIGIQAEVGDTIRIPYQVLRGEELDYRQEGDFIICGMTEDTKEQKEKGIYGAYVSEAFARKTFSEDEIRYYTYLHLKTGQWETREEIEDRMKSLASSFGLGEEDYGDNKEYITANYVDPALISGVGLILLVIIFAGVITIYSIYYVSMPQRVRDYGRLRAIGATKAQVRKIVLREGMLTACIAIPIGLLIGTPLIKGAMYALIDVAEEYNAREMEAASQIMKEGRLSLHPAWLYAAVIVIALFTVWLSLRKPMKMAAKITPVEAMRFQDEESKKKTRKGYDSLNLFRLTKSNLARNKKRTVITILSMSMTGTLFLAVGTILACADPKEISSAAVEGEYQIQVESESGNKEHPELEWSAIQQNNPLTEAFKQQVEELPGIERAEYAERLKFSCEELGEGTEIGSLEALPEQSAEELKKHIVEGKFDEEGWKSGEKVLVCDSIQHWNPELKAGSTYRFRIETGNETIEKEVEVMAVVDAPVRLREYGAWMISREAMKELSRYNANDGLILYADKPYDEALEQMLQELIEQDERLSLKTWNEEYEMWQSVMGLMYLSCYGFLGVLGIICIMNLINTIINSIYVRMKEIGMMQAIGLSEKQLMKMLQMEGLFYTAGTLILSIVFGSLAGYGTFLYAKADKMFNIQYFHYPVEAAAAMIGIVLIVQVVLVFLVGRSLRKQSMIDRIRFNE